MSKETYYSVKRDLLQTYYSVKRDLQVNAASDSTPPFIRKKDNLSLTFIRKRLLEQKV